MRSMIAAGALTAAGSRVVLSDWPPAATGDTTRLDSGWRFLRADDPVAALTAFDDADWESVTLPHTARIEALVTGPAGSETAQWQGVCWYRRDLRVEESADGQRTFLKFDAAMNVADVFIDGARVGGHAGGYLPFVLDITERVASGQDHVLAVRLDNRDNPITGPKPLAQLDFNMYHGLYRSVYLIRKNPLHVSDPLFADRPAGGGVFVTYPTVTRQSATVRVQTHVRNDDRRTRRFIVRFALLSSDGRIAASAQSSLVSLKRAADAHVTRELQVANPQLWSLANPYLYTLRVEVLAGTQVVDSETMRIGIRRIEISAGGFSINGEPMFLRGTNRHQEYPYIGYALSDAAQYRDARKIKEAGFDFVRLSHYAHSPAFMDACDELGLVVMNCIPGWQYFNPDPTFAELQYRNCRDLIRRDRNHPCVVLWEVSLNETGMPAEFIARTHAIAHQEYPGDQCYTAGWVHGYDVFIQARQHGGCRDERNSACLVSEYGDWEYYAMNAGLNQQAWEQLTPADSNSRQLRWQGERALLQQAANFQEAHDDNRQTIAFADGLWVMYDYNRGYAPDIESSGCMDIFRLPKFSYFFFMSQRSAAERLSNAAAGPMVFIASYWTPASAREVRVFSNCEEVALHLNGRLLERKTPDRTRMSGYLAHPPFSFPIGAFEPGTLQAIGYNRGREVAQHTVRTPGEVERLALQFDTSGRAPAQNGRDHLFCHAVLQDANGTTVPDAWHNVAFGISGPGRVIGANPFASDAGIASVLIETEQGGANAATFALAILPGGNETRIISASASLHGQPPSHEIRFTTDGTEPGATSGLYEGPVTSNNVIRAALFVDGEIVTTLASDALKFRIPVSAPPEQRTRFRH